MKQALVISFVCLLFACGGAKQPGSERAFSLDSGTTSGSNQPATSLSTLLGEPAECINIPDADFSFDPNVKPLGAAHQQYLDDKVKFQAVPMQKPTSEITAVIGSTVAKFYPGAKVTTEDDFAKLPTGEPLPIGTFLSGLTEVQDATADEESGHTFAFEDNWNYFYETVYKGRQGLVFGADLAGVGATAEENSLTSFYYTKPQKSPAFYNYNGRKPIGENTQAALAKDRIAFEPVSKKEYFLTASDPDDFVALYMKDVYDQEHSMFFTTDLFAHTLHLLFDRMLASSEEEKFTPLLVNITSGFLEKVEEFQKQDKKDKPGYTKTLELAKAYFQVPQALLVLAPSWTVNTKYGQNEIIYQDADRETVLKAYPKKMQEEIDLIEQAGGYALSPNFKYKEDYSQYKPRGHYTKNGVLSAYFRAMMWFGRIHFYMSLAKASVLNPNETKDETKNAEDASLLLTTVAIVINKIAKENPELLAEWRTCFDPITKLIGMSDDLSLYDVMPALDKYPFGDLAAWSDDPKAIVDFLMWGMKQFPEPRISDNSVFIAPSVGNILPAAGFRLFGQRFTYDSYIHMQVSPPRLMSRDNVRGLDIMKAFGSQTADGLLAKSDYPNMPGLEDALDNIEKEFTKADTAFWSKTYYNRTLYLIKSQAQFEQGQGFFFTETPAWNGKAMLSSHGTWAELRHDTILYTKQCAAEMGGLNRLTFRTIPIPRPIHYVEPNRYFFQNAYLLIDELVKVMQNNSVFVAGYPKKFERYATVIKNLLTIAEQEIADRPITDEQNDYLVTIPRELADIILPADANDMSYTDDENQFRMALIADVYTNAQNNQVLETAVGIPYRLQVALDDGQGGKRIATGYTFSYYEFMHPMSDRMTDERWKVKVYTANPELEQYLPFWAKDILIKP